MTSETGSLTGEATRRRATRTGVVLSNKMEKTVVVAVERRVSHTKYTRVVTRTSKFYAHDELQACKPGDVVTIVECRPMSRLKRWRIRSVTRDGQPVKLEPRAAAAPAPEEAPAAPRRKRARKAAEGESRS